ncbi:hypothetical protein MMC29_000853 [Sticta canariensis]|nr:hypothetical protein [Sticta canariensis]
MKNWRENSCFSKFDFSGKGIDLHDPKDIFIGRYDYGYLCMPQNPFTSCSREHKERKPPPFYAVDQLLSVFVALLMGLQHALAMVGGLITPPLLIGFLAYNDIDKGILTPDEAASRQNNLVATSLIVTGICTIVHVIQIPFPFCKLVYGTGVISVAGISFTFLQTAQGSIGLMMVGAAFSHAKMLPDAVSLVLFACALCADLTSVHALQASGQSFDVAYGRFIGTLLVSTWLVVAISFMPEWMVKAIFPPFVPGVTIFLIGAALIGAGFDNWGGGAACVDKTPGEPETCLVPYNATEYQQTFPGINPEAFTINNGSQYMNGTCFGADTLTLCSVGHTSLPFGCPEYVGLGFLVFVTLVVIEVFGSPFMRNAGAAALSLLAPCILCTTLNAKGWRYALQCILCILPWWAVPGAHVLAPLLMVLGLPFSAEVIIALLFGYLIAGVVTREGQHYVDTSTIKASPGITFLWTQARPAPALPSAFLACSAWHAELQVIMVCLLGLLNEQKAAGYSLQHQQCERQLIGGLVLADVSDWLLCACAVALPCGPALDSPSVLDNAWGVCSVLRVCHAAFLVTAVEAIGDITATEEASRLPTAGSDHRRRIQGGLMGDGVNCFFGALAFTLPTTTFAQNNGVIVLTRCASRSAGVCCGLWLFVFGVLAKISIDSLLGILSVVASGVQIGAFFVSIPAPVLGGMTTFLFANVCVSGIKVITLGSLSRRVRFITAVALGLGLGVTIVPGWATNHLWPVVDSMSEGLRSFRDACILVLSNGFAVGCLITIILHLIIPEEHDVDNPDDEIRSPEGHGSFTTHGPHKATHTPAAYYNDQRAADNEDSTTMKPVELAKMEKGDDTAHAASQV